MSAARDDLTMAATAARRFYLEDRTKVDIADELGISRFKVARLLELARSEGIVSITLHDGGVPDAPLSTELAAALGLDECLVVSSQGSGEDRRAQVGAAAAGYLADRLEPSDVLGLAWGRTLAAMTGHLRHVPVRTIVQLTGVAGTQVTESPVELVRQVSLRSKAEAHGYFVPQLVRDAATAASLAQQANVAATMALFDRVTFAAVAIGSWNPPVSQIHEVLTQDELQILRRAGVEADVAGILLDGEGREIDEGFVERSLSIGSDRLRRIPHVVAVAGSPAKARAVRAVARSGLIDCLVTDRPLAESLLRAAGAGPSPGPPEPR
jgi:DNA-binding transcriptional regulator LsrR (DeoR family)